MITRFGLPLAAVVLLAFAIFHVYGAQSSDGKPAPPISPARNPFPDTVAGAGMVEAQTENIAIGSPVPGIVEEVFVKVSDKLEAGTRLFRLDNRTQEAELAFRKAALAAAEAELIRLENQPRPEQLQMTQSLVSEAEANLIDQRDQYLRTRELVNRKVATENDLVTREQAYRAAQAKLAHVKAQLAMDKAGAWEYDKQVARAAVEQARSQVKQVETELERLVVRSRVDGEVLQVNVRPGEFVGAPPTEALIVLGNVNQLHVRVDIDEYDIHRFVPGAPALAMLKGQPKEQFELKFVRVEPYVVPKRSLTGENTERVDTRVLQVIYSLDPGKRQLYVGQQLDVFVNVSKGAQAQTAAR